MVLDETDTATDDGIAIETDDAAGEIEPKAKVQPPRRVSEMDDAGQFRVLSGWMKHDAEHSNEWRNNATYWKGFRAGEQWNDEDRQILEGQDRPVIVFNRVLAILKAVAGMEINGRHEVAFLPANTEDTKSNEVLAGADKWMESQCDAEDEESEAFDDTITTGMGWTENRMSYLENPAGMYVEEAIDCREMYWDRTAKKKNLKDSKRRARARRMPLRDAMEMFPGRNRVELDAVWFGDITPNYPIKSIEEKWRRTPENSEEDAYDDTCEVTIIQIQWIEREPYWLVADPMTNAKTELSEQQYQTLVERLKPYGVDFQAVRLLREKYMQAFLGGQGVMLRKAHAAPIKGMFSWQCITGEYDAVNRSWFGLVKVLRDPQMWANKWLSQILHILNSTAKGGILAERTAFDDEREAEDSYAQPEAITWLADGALSGEKPKVMPKPGGGMTDAYLGLLTFAISSFKDVSGVNLELLGQQDQNQPGILEAMRKQAGMTILATLFDALRKFRKNVGRSRLYFIQTYLSDGRLARITGADGNPEAIRLVKEKTYGEYDVVVSDAPTSPNQKEANWAIIQPMLAIFKDQLMANPQVLVILLEFSPLPSRVVEAIKTLIKEQTENPEMKRQQQEDRQLLVGRQVAIIKKDESAALLNQAKAASTEVDDQYNLVIAQNLMNEGKWDELTKQIELIKANATAKVADAKVARERVGTQLDIAKLNNERARDADDSADRRTGRLIEHMLAVGKRERDIAGARKDHAIAETEELTPIAAPGPPA